MTSDDFKKKKQGIVQGIDRTLAQMEKDYQETVRVRKVIENTHTIIEDLDAQFKNQTGLTDVDITFLFLAIGLQVARQYILSNEKMRVSAKEGDKLVDNALSLVPRDFKDILVQSVPYDAIKTGDHVSETGLSGTTHRYRTLGHDPVLGWIFGTANIMTNALTKTDLETYQVKNMYIIRHYPLGVVGMMDKAIEYSIKDPMLLAVSVLRQAVHFGSDYFTKQGLPVPLIATVNNDLAQKMLTKWHIDAWSITRGASLSIFINQLIYFMHQLFNDGTTDMEIKLYEVRTRKILRASNLVATSTNLIYSFATQDFTKLDIGGLAVTIYRLITDTRFIRKVKEEFVFGSYRETIMGDDII